VFIQVGATSQVICSTLVRERLVAQICTLLSPTYSDRSPSCLIGMLGILADSEQIPNKFLAVLGIPNCPSGVRVNSEQNKFLAHLFLLNSE
jgi:hypothetical protein